MIAAFLAAFGVVAGVFCGLLVIAFLAAVVWLLIEGGK